MNTKLAERNSLEKYFFRRKTFPLAVFGQFSDKTVQPGQKHNIFSLSSGGRGSWWGWGGILMLLWTKTKMKGNIEAFFYRVSLYLDLLMLGVWFISNHLMRNCSAFC